ncbi:hypothetical protein F2Q70_00015343 [Brassica cretica]|uniref:Uncharacterized protein n=1 Tax=Brassica cretica TaxID=69181 RepID=A0A8S9HMC2_BRACR|nr:hypothetical protein F2Q70_00015343 [Brassica cretica]
MGCVSDLACKETFSGYSSWRSSVDPNDFESSSHEQSHESESEVNIIIMLLYAFG